MTGTRDLFESPQAGAAATGEQGHDAAPDDPFGTLLKDWWWTSIADRKLSQARAMAARLRRARSPAAVLSERAVHDLIGRALAQEDIPSPVKRRLRDPDALARMAVVLAEMREHHRQPLARRLGGEDAAMSELRFRRMLGAEGDELTAALRRGAAMADRKCDVPGLARDLLWWGEKVRVRWCFLYYGSEPPGRTTPDTAPGDDAS
jgi:CRISPR system Cascade subunit CasB